MFRSRTAAAVAIPALLVALTACTAGTPGVDPGPGATEPAAGDGVTGATTECLTASVWLLDKEDLAAQLAAHLASSGLTVTESHADGRQTVEFSPAGAVTAITDVTYTLTVDGGDGLVMTLVQTHSGTTGGDWAWVDESETVSFDNWDNSGYSVQNTVLINGIASDTAFDIPSDDLGGEDMQTECTGTTLSTHVDPSPFTQHWTHAD